MKTPAVVPPALFVFLVLGACGEAPRDEAAPDTSVEPASVASADPCPSLNGSWVLVSIADDASALAGTFESDPAYQEAPSLKIINDTHWMFIRQSSDTFIHAQGGRYSLERGGFYTEFVEYSAIPENVGQSFQFSCRLEGDSLWHHVGGQGDTRYIEVWRRVP